MSATPRIWLEFDLEDYPALATVTYRWGQRAIAAAQFIEGRIPANGITRVTRRASSMSGEYYIDNAAIVLADRDGLIRSLLAATSTQWFKNRHAAIKLLSEAGLAAALVPRMLFRGRVSNAQITDGRSAALDVEDVLAPYLDREYPQYVLGDAYPYVMVEPEDVTALAVNNPGLQMALGLRDQVIPIYYGPFVDSAVDPVTGLGAGKGMCPTYFMGYTSMGTNAPAVPAWAFLSLQTNPSDGDTVTIDTVTFTFRNTPSGGNDVQIGGSSLVSKQNLVAAANAALSTVDLSIPGTLGAALNTGNVIYAVATTPGEASNSIAVLCSTEFWFGEGGIETTSLDHGSDAITFPDTTLPEPTLEMQQMLGGVGANYNTWGELVVGLGEYDIPNVYASNGVGFTTQPAEATDSGQARRILLNSDRYGADILAPGHPNWPFSTNWVLRNGYRLTVIYARGPILWHHITGIVNITVDLCGWKNASGVAIDQAGFAYQDFLTQHVIAHDGEGYTAGPPLSTVPTFTNGDAMFWTSKIQDWQTMTGDRLGTDDGYLISMALNERTTLRDILRTFHVTFDAFSAKNWAGQLYLFSIDDLADPTDGVAVRERMELTDLPAPRIAWTEIENALDYTVGWDPEQKTPRTPTLTHTNDAAIAALKEERKPSSVRSLRYTSDDATASDVVGRRVMRLKDAPRYQPLPVRIGGVDRFIGEQVRVSHQDGFGAPGVGYLSHPMVILDHTMQNSAVTLEAFDVSRMLIAASRWASDAIPNWDSATEAQQIQYGFWADDNDTLGTANDPGTEWR